MPNLDGLEVLKEIRRQDPEVPILFVTAYGSKDLAMEALREGAYDYFTKPFDVDEIRVVVRRAMEKTNAAGGAFRSFHVIWMPRSGSIKSLVRPPKCASSFHLIQRIAGQDVTVLDARRVGYGKGTRRLSRPST